MKGKERERERKETRAREPVTQCNYSALSLPPFVCLPKVTVKIDLSVLGNGPRTTPAKAYIYVIFGAVCC